MINNHVFHCSMGRCMFSVCLNLQITDLGNSPEHGNKNLFKYSKFPFIQTKSNWNMPNIGSHQDWTLPSNSLKSGVSVVICEKGELIQNLGYNWTDICIVAVSLVSPDSTLVFFVKAGHLGVVELRSDWFRVVTWHLVSSRLANSFAFLSQILSSLC